VTHPERAAYAQGFEDCLAAVLEGRRRHRRFTRIVATLQPWARRVLPDWIENAGRDEPPPSFDPLTVPGRQKKVPAAWEAGVL